MGSSSCNFSGEIRSVSSWNLSMSLLSQSKEQFEIFYISRTKTDQINSFLPAGRKATFGNVEFARDSGSGVLRTKSNTSIQSLVITVQFFSIKSAGGIAFQFSSFTDAESQTLAGLSCTIGT
jgi:hypothetical protein